MNAMLTYDEFSGLAKKAARVCLYQEIPCSPHLLHEHFSKIMTLHTDAALLESGSTDHHLSHYSFIAYDAFAELMANQEIVARRVGKLTEKIQANPFEELRKMIHSLRCAYKKETLFSGSIIGSINYDAVRFIESIPDQHADHHSLDMCFRFYRTTLRYNHHEKNLFIGLTVDINENNLDAIYHQGMEEINQLIHFLNKESSLDTKINNTPALLQEVKTDLSDEAFMSMVEKAKEHIKRGDIFQVVLSRRFSQPIHVEPFQIYQVLRKRFPAPYHFYLPLNDTVIVGASPECLISVQDGEVTIHPIAGTRKRKLPDEDETIANELLNDEKERAEHMMLVDLARNDLGRVAEPGSVKVSELLKIKYFSHVIHICSKVCATLKKNNDAIDALKACFPAGTLSGAPKIRAMEIIDSLEISRRGLYGGAICRFDYEGNLDSCIAIRMAMIKNGVATSRTGAGIVYDSNPQSEADETRHKAASILHAISLAHKNILNKPLVIIDNYDSFTYNLYQVMSAYHSNIQVIRNDKITVEELIKLNPLGIILSPGPGRPEESKVCLAILNTIHILPILGVCLGHQAMTISFGGEVIGAPEIIHGKKDLITHTKQGLYKHLPSPLEVGRYHSLLAKRENFPAELIIEAENEEGLIMGIRHKTYPIYGVQFHPESILTPEGHLLLKNFVALCYDYS